jgi:predicted enzyme related to lactoylglutathione lyase
MGDPVNTFEIAGHDLKKLGAFYQGAFDWKLGTPQPAYTMIFPREDLPVAGVLFPARPDDRTVRGSEGHVVGLWIPRTR